MTASIDDRVRRAHILGGEDVVERDSRKGDVVKAQVSHYGGTPALLKEMNEILEDQPKSRAYEQLQIRLKGNLEAAGAFVGRSRDGDKGRKSDE